MNSGPFPGWVQQVGLNHQLNFDLSSLHNLSYSRDNVLSVMGTDRWGRRSRYVLKHWQDHEAARKEINLMHLLSGRNLTPELEGFELHAPVLYHLTRYLSDHQYPETNELRLWTPILQHLVDLHLQHPRPVLESTLTLCGRPLLDLLEQGQGFMNQQDRLLQNVHALLEDITPEIRQVLQEETFRGPSLPEMLHHLTRALSSWPHTSLLHGDLHRWNLRCQQLGGHVDVKMLDWEFAGFGVSQLDLAHVFWDDPNAWVQVPLLPGMMHGDFGRALLRHYHQLHARHSQVNWMDFLWMQRVCNCYRSICMSLILPHYPTEAYFAPHSMKLAFHLYRQHLQEGP